MGDAAILASGSGSVLGLPSKIFAKDYPERSAGACEFSTLASKSRLTLLLGIVSRRLRARH